MTIEKALNETIHNQLIISEVMQGKTITGNSFH